MPVRTENRQYRLMLPMSAVTAGEKLIDSPYYVQGFATTYNQPYDLYGGYKEQIARGALTGADLTDVIMQYDHEGRVLARNRNKTLVLVPDNAGGFLIGADLSKGESARQLYEEITNELTDRMSWAFTIASDGDEFDEAAKMFTITKVKKVYDVSAVSLPANDATEISARSRVEGFLEAGRLEQLALRRRIIAIRSLL